MRAFIALELPVNIRDSISQLQQRLRQSGAKVSWVKPENFHLTLRFLGDVTAQQIVMLTEELPDACTASPPLQLSIGELGFFPNARRPGVVWVGLTAETGDLSGLQQAIESAAQRIGLKPENKHFHAHITLARIRDHRRAGTLIDAVHAEEDFTGDAFTIGNVALFSSELNPKGAIYHRIKEFPL